MCVMPYFFASVFISEALCFRPPVNVGSMSLKGIVRSSPSFRFRSVSEPGL